MVNSEIFWQKPAFHQCGNICFNNATFIKIPAFSVQFFKNKQNEPYVCAKHITVFFVCYQCFYSNSSRAFEEEACTLSDTFLCECVFMCVAAIWTNVKLVLSRPSALAVIFRHTLPGPTAADSHDQSVTVEHNWQTEGAGRRPGCGCLVNQGELS